MKSIVINKTMKPIKAKTLFISPHQDDETLFGAYTIMREKPLVIVCTDSYIQELRGDGITNEERTNESKRAMELLGVEVEFLHIPDNNVSFDILKDKLKDYDAEIVYAPAIELGGNPTHNLVGKVADELFNNVKHYMTYGSADLTKTKGSELVIPTEEERELKIRALACYPSQMRTQCVNFFININILNYESFQ